MMKDFNEEKGQSIDEFYGESHSDTKSLDHSVEFHKKLQQTSEKLDILNEDIFDFDINTLGIIERAEEIKESKKIKIELGFFLSAAVLILGLYGVLGFVIGFKFLLLSQVVLMAIIPWIMVPITIKRRGSEV